MATKLTQPKQPKWTGKMPSLQNLPYYKKSPLVLKDYLREIPGATKKVLTSPFTSLTRKIDKEIVAKTGVKKRTDEYQRMIKDL